MLDIQFIRDNSELVQKKSEQKGYKVDIPKLLELDDRRRSFLTNIEQVTAKQRKLLKPEVKSIDPKEKHSFEEKFRQEIAQAKELKEQINGWKKLLEPIEVEREKLLRAVPNMPLEGVPVGASEDENVTAKEVGVKTEYDFKPKTHWELGETRGWIDKERAAKIAGSRFAYLKGDLARLQFAIIQFVLIALTDEKILQKLISDNNLELTAKPFSPVLPPAMLKTEPYVASARLNAEEMTYKLADDDLWLNASAEHTLCTMYWNEILPQAELPIRYIGYSTSFRREAGTYGKDTEGIIRMHQFDKLEMEVFSDAATGADEHKLLIAIQEYLVQQLGLPYQLIQKCTADIGKPNASGYDINCWFPGQDRYIETHTADYMTDYQARDLKIRTKSENGTELVHTNDATAFALGRILAAIIENYQTSDGHVKVPGVLAPLMNGQTEI